jgi:hypothetical protein
VTLLRLSRILNYLKHRADAGLALLCPCPAPDTTLRLDPDLDREEISDRLVQWFLNDGNIRGVDQEGQLYVHKTDPDLCRAFAATLRRYPPVGGKPPGGNSISR